MNTKDSDLQRDSAISHETLYSVEAVDCFLATELSEILETSIPDPKFLRGIAVLRTKSHRFVLDEFNFREQLMPFLPQTRPPLNLIVIDDP